MDNTAGRITDEKNGRVSFRYLILDVMEKFSISPIEWDKLDRQTQLELIEKRKLDIEFECFINDKYKEDDK